MLPSNQIKFIEAINQSDKCQSRINRELKRIKDSHYQFVDFQEITPHVWQLSMLIPENHKLHTELEKYAKMHNHKNQLQFEVTFPKSYPFEPPFIRIILPRFINLKAYVTSGGSICMENITNSKNEAGYSPAMTIENLLVAVMTLILTKNNSPLNFDNGNPATWDEAVEGFKYTTNTDNWEPHQFFK